MRAFPSKRLVFVTSVHEIYLGGWRWEKTGPFNGHSRNWGYTFQLYQWQYGATMCLFTTRGWFSSGDSRANGNGITDAFSRSHETAVWRCLPNMFEPGIHRASTVLPPHVRASCVLAHDELSRCSWRCENDDQNKSRHLSRWPQQTHLNQWCY